MALLRRVIYLYLNRLPDPALDAPRLALLRFIYGDQGQRTAAKRGYAPLPASIAWQALRERSQGAVHGIELVVEWGNVTVQRWTQDVQG